MTENLLQSNPVTLEQTIPSSLMGRILKYQGVERLHSFIILQKTFSS